MLSLTFWPIHNSMKAERSSKPRRGESVLLVPMPAMSGFSGDDLAPDSCHLTGCRVSQNYPPALVNLERAKCYFFIGVFLFFSPLLNNCRVGDVGTREQSRGFVRKIELKSFNVI